ncbi:hypothetical protein [Telluribacter sp.]|jgi:hypothetical protein|uniref:hypothetical protein n=1 Tax=Telluribacter sp. TaxID=1978767 RepID=UPI002E11FC3D|nr:hypothetical protein [Telluribacter sp.]
MKLSFHTFCRFFSWLLLVALVITCRPKVVEPDLLADGKPRIISVDFPGIPKEDIIIDQKNFLIIIKAPPTLLTNVIPVIKVTENARIHRGGCNSQNNKGTECFAFGPSTIELTYTDEPRDYPKVVTTYKLVILASGPIELADIAAPIEYELFNGSSGNISIPCRNLYGNKLPVQVKLTHRESGEVVVVDNLNKITPSLAFGWDTLANHLRVTLYYSSLMPGLYDCEIHTEEGEILTLPQPIKTVKGPVQVNGLGGVEGKVLPNGELIMSGNNLFPGDFSAVLVTPNDEVIPLSDLRYSRYGDQVITKLPASVTFGQYVFQMRDISRNETFCRRLRLRRQDPVPFEIFTLNDWLGACSIKGPVNLSINTTISIAVNAYDAKARLKLTSISDPNRKYYGKAEISSQLSSMGMQRAATPSDVPPGQYYAVIEEIDANQKVLREGPPFWRIVQIN